MLKNIEISNITLLDTQQASNYYEYIEQSSLIKYYIPASVNYEERFTGYVLDIANKTLYYPHKYYLKSVDDYFLDNSSNYDNSKKIL